MAGCKAGAGHRPLPQRWFHAVALRLDDARSKNGRGQNASLGWTVTSNVIENAVNPQSKMKINQTLIRLSVIAVCGLLTGSAARAADVSGQWRGEFDSQVGPQKYLFTFQASEGKLDAKATAEAQGQPREVEFKEVKLEGDTLTFVETQGSRTTKCESTIREAERQRDQVHPQSW